ncbi:hypothetical protein Tco_0016503 [Tanacetum coccineum]
MRADHGPGVYFPTTLTKPRCVPYFHQKESLQIPLDEIHIDDKLHFVEEPVEILEREIKKLRRSRIPIIKVRWNSKRGPEFTCGRYARSVREKYSLPFTKTRTSKNVASLSLGTWLPNGWRHVNISFSGCIQIAEAIPLLDLDNQIISLTLFGIDNPVGMSSAHQFERTETTKRIMSEHLDVAVMSSASSAVTYTSVYTDSAPGRVFWGADEEVSDGGTPRVIVYGYDGLPMQPVAPPSPDYVPGPEHPASPDYVPGPEHPPSPIEIPFVPEPEYPEYLVPSEDEAPMEDQPLPADASPVALSPGYVPDSDPEEDPEEDSEEEHADYPADGGDGDDEPSDDDTDDDDADDDEEPFEDEDEDEEEEEHLAPADSSAIPMVDPVPSAGDTEAFETDESAPTPRPPQIRIPFAQTRLRRARKSVRPEPPMSASMEARIAEHAAAPTPPLPVVSSPLPLPSPLTTSPTDTGAPLGYRAAGILMRAAVASPPLPLPPTSPRTDIPEADMPPRKRACLTTPAPGYEVGESSAAGAARQPGSTPAVDTWDEIVEAMMEIAPTTLEGVDQRVTELDTTVRQRTEEFEVRFEEAHDDRAYLGALVNTLYRERLQHRRTALAIDREAIYARIAWTSSEERSAAIEAHVRTLEAQVATLIAQTTSLQTQLTTALGRIATLEARDPEPQDAPAETGSSSKCLDVVEPPGEIKKARIHDIGNLRVRGTDLLTYNQRFQELALMCDRMFLEESAKVKRYVGGLPDMIHGSVKASKPQSMQESIEFATEMMDKKMLTAAERQAENKRKFEDTSRNNQNQQQPFKRNNVRGLPVWAQI